jgi:hypothetical protein
MVTAMGFAPVCKIIDHGAESLKCLSFWKPLKGEYGSDICLKVECGSKIQYKLVIPQAYAVLA